MTKPKIKSVITNLVNFITEETTKNPTGISATHFFWPQKKSWSPMEAEFDDIGDYVVFVVWAGKVFRNRSWQHFGADQLTLWQDYKHASGWYFTQIDCLESQQKNSWLISLYDLQDAVLGLYELYYLTHNEVFRTELENLLTQIKGVAQKNHHQLPNQISSFMELAIPWVSVNSAVTGLMAEHAFLTATQLDQQSYETLGQSLVERQLDSLTYKKIGLFSQGENAYLRSLSPYTRLKPMKETTNMLFALLQRPHKYKQAIKDIANRFLSLQQDSGAFRAVIDTKTGEYSDTYYNKTQNFALIDSLLEVSFRVDKKLSLKCVQAAQACAQFWISQKDKQTGLIPDYVGFDNKPAYYVAKLDQSADLYSSFLRLYSATKKQKYLKEAELGAQLLDEYFGQTGWWSRVIQTQTGQVATDNQVPTSDRPAGRNLTKYVGGALRFYLALYEVKSGKHMYKDKDLWLLSRDR
jgi:hypothetical protein